MKARIARSETSITAAREALGFDTLLENSMRLVTDRKFPQVPPPVGTFRKNHWPHILGYRD